MCVMQQLTVLPVMHTNCAVLLLLLLLLLRLIVSLAHVGSSAGGSMPCGAIRTVLCSVSNAASLYHTLWRVVVVYTCSHIQQNNTTHLVSIATMRLQAVFILDGINVHSNLLQAALCWPCIQWHLYMHIKSIAA
jgi:hypothetical protein